MGKYWFHLRKLKKKIEILTFYAILYLNNMFGAKKNFRLSRAAVAPPLTEICATPTASPLKARELKFCM
jgi:hypothetical protein